MPTMQRSTKLQRIAIVLGVLIVASIAGYGALWYTVKSNIDERIASVKPIVSISYDGLSVSPLGKITLQKLKFTIPSVDDSLYAADITVVTDDISTLVTMLGSEAPSKPPASMSIKADNLRFYLDGNLGKLLELDADKNPFLQLETLVCGGTPYIGLAELKEMGYKEIAMDFEFRYRYLSTRETFDFTIDSDAKGFAKSRISGKLSGIENLIPGHSMDSLKFDRLDFYYSEDAYTSKRNALCAKRSKIDVSEYVARQAYTAYDFLTQLGITLGPGLKQFYKEQLKSSGDIYLGMKPQTLFETMDSLHLYSASDIIEMLDIELTLDNKPYQDLSLTIDQDLLMASLEPLMQDNSGIANGGNSNSSVPMTQAQLEQSMSQVPVKSVLLISVPAEQWVGKIGKPVEVTTDDGRSFKGKLMSVSEEMVDLDSRMRGGSITYHLKRKNITELKAYERK